MTFTAATREYESWLAGVIPHPLVGSDLDYKHAQMRLPHDPYPFFRGTYYRWVQRWAEAAGPLADAPRVLAIGDVHVANFGTWRDADGRLCGGVNDFDDADELPYTNDLVRLAASVWFARPGGGLNVRLAEACGSILDGYRTSLERGGVHFVLEEHHGRLRELAMNSDRRPKKFWARLARLRDLPEPDLPPDARTLLDASLPAAGLALAYRPRPEVGMGSLGRPRYVALAEWVGSWVCREVKATAPPATAWANNTGTPSRAAEAVGRAVRSPDPFYRPNERWVVRRLAPRSSKLELSHLRKWAGTRRVLRAMGAETANVHLGTPLARQVILADLSARPAGWLAAAARSMCDLLAADRAEWQQDEAAG